MQKSNIKIKATKKESEMESLVYLREGDAAQLFNVTRVTIFNWANSGQLKRERKNKITYFVAKLIFEENGRTYAECYPETISKIKRAEINAK